MVETRTGMFKIGIDQYPRIGDLGIDNEGTLYRYSSTGEWKSIPKDFPIDLKEEQAVAARKEMYANGITNYWDKDIRMTIREDGTEYIDKRDMPA